MASEGDLPFWGLREAEVSLAGLRCRTLGHNLAADDKPSLAVILFHGYGASNDQFEGLISVVLRSHPELAAAKVMPAALAVVGLACVAVYLSSGFPKPR